MKSWLTRILLPTTLRLLRILLPVRRVVVVVSGVPTEGNAIEVVRELLARYPGRVVWIGGPSFDFCVAQGLERASLRTRYSRAGVWAYLTAEAVFATHGLYGQPRRVPRKLTINLWHGSGMKAMPPGLLHDRTPRGPAADLLVSGARIWGDYYASLTDLRPDEVVYCANPRVDAFAHPVGPSVLDELGVAPRPFVLWMPTFRTTAGSGAGWSDSTDTRSADALRSVVETVVAACRERGVGLVLKAHPLDADARAVDGAVSVTDADLERCGVTLYQLLGASSGLLTDASSVWTDYLLLDRPIGFVFPDRAGYVAGRGVHPSDVMDWLPGPLVEDTASVDAFLTDVLAGGGASRAARRRTSEHVGLAVPTDGSAAALLDHLSATDTRLATTLTTAAVVARPTPSRS